MDSAERARVVARLNDAADLIEQKGWWNGEGAQGGNHCVITAIAEVTPYTEQHAPVQIAFERRLGLLDFASPSWNDQQPNGEVVVEALRTAAYKLSLEFDFEDAA